MAGNDNTLASLKRGQTGTIQSIDATDPQVQRLMVLGLVEGTEVELAGAALGAWVPVVAPVAPMPCADPVMATRSYVNAVSSSAALNSSALLNRSAGSFSSPFDTTARICFGTVGRASDTGRGFSVRMRT